MSRETKRTQQGPPLSGQHGQQAEPEAETMPTLAPSGAGFAPPDHPTHRALRYDRVRVTQRSLGNRAVQRQLGGVVQRDEPDWSTLIANLPVPNDPGRPADMGETNWSALAPPAIWAHPLRPVTITLPAAAPQMPPRVRDPWADFNRPAPCPPHHRRPDEGFSREDFDRMRDLEYQFERQEAWGAIRGDANRLQGVFNTVVPLVNAFEDARTDPTLSDPSVGMNLPPGSSAPGAERPTLPEVADQQQVARGTGGGVRVGELFSEEWPADGRLPGTELDLSAGAERGVGRASQSDAVRNLYLETQEVDGRLNAGLSNVRTKTLAVEAAALEVQTAEAELNLEQARQDQQSAQSDADRIRAGRDDVKRGITQVLTIVKSLASIAKASNPLDAVGGVADIVGVAADRLVDASFASELAAAQSRLTSAIQRVGSLATEAAMANIRAKNAALEVARSELETARLAVVPILTERRRAYRRLADTAAAHSGASGRDRSRIAAAIAAVPVVETVVARAGAVADAVAGQPVTYTTRSGVGYSMALHAGHDLSSFVNSLSILRGVQSDFSFQRTYWQQRLDSLRRVVNQLGASAGVVDTR